jgi:hypothetical protein
MSTTNWVIGFFDYFTGDYSLLLLYLVSITLMSYFNGKLSTLILSLICSATFLFVNKMLATGPVSVINIRCWNSLMDAACFDPYFTTKGPDKVAGIGLFMSKTIVEKNMEGRLTCVIQGQALSFE